MLIATFNDTTGWRGKTITFDDERFLLEGHGRVSPKNIMKYDEQGQLTWATDGTRAWVGSRASSSTPQESTTPIRSASSAGTSGREAAIVKRVEFLRKKADVFDAILCAVPRVAGMRVVTSERSSGTVAVKVALGGLHWGGNIEALVVAETVGKSSVDFSYAPKGVPGLGTVTAEHLVQHRKNLDRLVFATQQQLAKKPPRGSAADLIATFGPTTEWAGKRIIFENGVLILEGHGPVASADLLNYDGQGQVMWATDTTRAWVEDRARAESGVEQKPEQNPYYKMPAAAMKVYAAHGGSTDVDAVMVGSNGQCLVTLAQSCIIVKPSIVMTNPPMFAEFPYDNIESIEVYKEDLALMIDVRTSSYQEPAEGPEGKSHQRRPNCFLAKMWSKEVPAYVDELRRRAGLLDTVTAVAAVVRECSVLGGHGLPLEVGNIYDLFFGSDELALLDRRDGRVHIRVSYASIQVLDVGGSGAQQSGGGFIGGGFGLEGAVTGMLVGTALNLLTTRTKIDTVICLRTDAAEVHFHTSKHTPSAVQMGLSKVFEALRQLEAARSHAVSIGETPAPTASVANEIAKLGELRARGLLSDEEFEAAKRKVLDAL